MSLRPLLGLLYCQTCNISGTKSQNLFLVLLGSCLCPIHWSEVLSREWRCSWSSSHLQCILIYALLIKLCRLPALTNLFVTETTINNVYLSSVYNGIIYTRKRSSNWNGALLFVTEDCVFGDQNMLSTTKTVFSFQIIQMLCQILQTDDVNAVQAWLCSAGDRGEEMATRLLCYLSLTHWGRDKIAAN